MSGDWRIGSGYDLHSVIPDRPLLLGGVRIDSAFGLGGHTDGDVVLHALIDAMFGAAGLDDIGEHFPDSEASLEGASSTVLLARACSEVGRCGWRINNIDLTILAERPRLSQYKQSIRRSLADLLAIEPDRISVKAKTNEGHDAVGQGRAIACQASVTLVRPKE